MTFRQPVGDFFAPFFRVRFIKATKVDGIIVGPDGEPLEQVTDIPAGSQVEMSGTSSSFRVGENDQMSQLRSYATSLTITTEGAALTRAALHMEPMYEDALKIIDDEVIQWNSIMIAEWGYLDPTAGATSENKYSKTGIFTIQQPELNLSQDGATIDILGVDPFGLTLVKRETRREWDRNGGYSTDLKIITELVERNGMKLDTSRVGLSPAPAALGPGASSDFLAFTGINLNGSQPGHGVLAIHALEVEHPLPGEPSVLEQSGENDWIFFQRIVLTNNCTFYAQGATVFLIDMNKAKGVEANYRLMMYQQLQNDYDIPMESFSTGALATLFWPGEAKGTKAVTQDPDTNETKNAAEQNSTELQAFDPSTASDHTNLGPKVSHGQGEADGKSVKADGETFKPNPPYDANQAGKGFYVAWGTPNRVETSKQNARWAALKSGVNAQATIPGTPAIETMQTVEVRGVGKIMSGYYLVKKATHTISTGGYETSLDLVREGSSGDPVAGEGEQPAVPANPSTAEGGAEGDVTPPTPEPEATSS